MFFVFVTDLINQKIMEKGAVEYKEENQKTLDGKIQNPSKVVNPFPQKHMSNLQDRRPLNPLIKVNSSTNAAIRNGNIFASTGIIN